MRIIRRSYGERGESERKIPGMKGERVVKEIGGPNRAAPPRTEAARAPFSTWAIIRGFADGQDIVESVNEFREHRPAIVLTHGFEDPYNKDHPPANHGMQQVRVWAEESGCPAERKGGRDEPRPSSSSSRTIWNNAISGRR